MEAALGSQPEEAKLRSEVTGRFVAGVKGDEARGAAVARGRRRRKHCFTESRWCGSSPEAEEAWQEEPQLAAGNRGVDLRLPTGRRRCNN